jgi:hypothetical protein
MFSVLCPLEYITIKLFPNCPFFVSTLSLGLDGAYAQRFCLLICMEP